MTDVMQRRLRDSWGTIGVVALAAYFVASSIYRATQSDWATAGTQGALGAFFLAVLVYSSVRNRHTSDNVPE